MQLTPLARECLKAFSTQLAKSYGVDKVSEQFSVTGPMETKLKNALLESVEFLGMITTADVDQIKGQVVSVGGYNITTGRKASGRFASEQGVNGSDYELKETDSCAFVNWSTLAVWANSGSKNEFMQRMSQNSTQRFALDVLRVGFNGVSAEADTDPVANPLGQDVNIGWHQIVKAKAAAQVMTDPINFDPAGTDPTKYDYKTLDAIVTELRNTLIHPSLRTDPRLVVLVGADLIAAAQTHLMNSADKPTEKVAAQQMDKSIGGLKAYTPPFFPGKRIVVTMLSNLHCYTQKGTRSRKAENVEDRKRHEDKYWRMEGYAIEEFEAYAAIDESAITIGSRP
ncbi:phage major capsid protein, P2 family [Shewanella algae]|uniref:phage major capsid protein, P2 family n=1 Tax=Shewanella algae TaxID=38313 RepID=UPI001AADC576|nr:phage major capsid protein, P2 family [Shewanella algae]MBO2682999.1 phage major capsid protein, P2 family [Shewanella algae]